MLVLLNSAIISLFLFEILDFLLLLLDYGCWLLLSSYDDKKGERWMQCVRGSYYEIMSLALKSFGCNDWGGAYTYFCFFPSIVLSSSKRGRLLILIPIFWCLQNKWMILIFLQDIFSVMKLFDSMNKCNWKKTKYAEAVGRSKRLHRTSDNHWVSSDAENQPIGRPKELKKNSQFYIIPSDAENQPIGRPKELKKISQTHCLLSDA